MKRITLEVSDATAKHLEDLRNRLDLSLGELIRLALAVTDMISNGQTVTPEDLKKHLAGRDGS